MVLLTVYLFRCVRYDVLFNNNTKGGEKITLSDATISLGTCIAGFPFSVSLTFSQRCSISSITGAVWSFIYLFILKRLTQSRSKNHVLIFKLSSVIRSGYF